MTVDELAELIAVSPYFEPGAMIWVKLPPDAGAEMAQGVAQGVAQVLRQVRERTELEFFLTSPNFQVEQLGHVALAAEVAEVLLENPQVELTALIATLTARFLIIPRDRAVTLRPGPSPPS